ncbi:MAG: glycosyltransferase, partial [Desulforhabdus sp.]|nr:glycosyltransferase [Desulforhabdus sp.]
MRSKNQRSCPAKSPAPFFVLSTGRSGTTSVASFFSRVPGCECLHEPSPRLIGESSAYRYGEFDHHRLVEILKETRLALDPAAIYGEANQTLSLILPVLNSAFPEAKYVWLIRSGLDVVASAVGRNWYTGLSMNGKKYDDSLAIEKAWIDGRIQGDRLGEFSTAEWIELTPFEKCCWYWEYINRTVDKDLAEFIHPEKYRTVKLEDFALRAEDLCHWLGLTAVGPLELPHHNRATYCVYPHNLWSFSEWEAFERRCGSIMDQHYRGWRLESHPSRQIACAESMIDTGRLDQASEILTHLQASGPELPRLQNAWGILEFKRGRLAEARSRYAQAVSLDPENLCFRLNLADLICFAQKLPQEALEVYRQALQHDPHNQHALMCLVQACRVLGRGHEAQQWMLALRQAAPGNPEVRQFLEQLEPNLKALAGDGGSKGHEAQFCCPVCETRAARFLTYGITKRPNARCPGCGAMERHRLLWLFLTTQTDVLSQTIKMLDVAPSTLISEKLKALPNVDYLSVDLSSPRAMQHMDLTCLDLPDNEFDFVLCYHVLEHIPNDRKALAEIFRVLKPGGRAVVQVPLYRNLKTSLEDPSVVDPRDREKLFGQKDHVRKYAPHDYRKRLEGAGFVVEVNDFASRLPPKDSRRFAINPNERLHICIKPTEATGEIHRLSARPGNLLPLQDRREGLLNRLAAVGWLERKTVYEKVFESVESRSKADIPAISVIVISWRRHPDTEKNLAALQKQRDANFELIFVDNGAAPDEFPHLKKFVDTWVRLSCNTGAYLARNIGAVFACAPILFFLEDDGIPADDLVEAHLRTHRRFQVDSVRGVYRPKTPENHLNIHAAHYDMGDNPFPWFVNLEGNASYRSEAFFAVGGWDDTNRFGHGGPELAYRLFQRDPDFTKQIYSPDPVIFHDYAKDEQHLREKRKKQREQLDRIRRRYPDFDEFLDKWKTFYLQPISLPEQNDGHAEQEQADAKSLRVNETPSVSIVIPTYNRLDLLKEALECVLNQTVQPAEILVVDDGSTDGTPDYVRGIDSELLRCIRKEHTGAPDTRNRGIVEARGNYILWVDDDDLLQADALSSHLSTLAKHPAADVVYGVLQVSDHATGEVTRLFNPKDWFNHPELLPSSLMSSCPIPNPGTLVRRSVYNRLGMYDAGFLRAHDYEFWTRCVPSLVFKKNHSIVCRYRIHQTNISAGDFIDLSYESLIVRRLVQRIGLRGIFPYWDWSQTEAAQAAALFMVAHRLFDLDDFFNARDLLEQVPHPMWTSEMMEMAIACAAYLGDRRQVADLFNRYRGFKQIPPKRPQAVYQRFSRYFRNLDRMAQFVASGKPGAANKAFKELIDEKHPLTSEMALRYGQMMPPGALPGLLSKLAHRAVHSNPSETTLEAAAIMARSPLLRDSLKATRHRVIGARMVGRLGNQSPPDPRKEIRDREDVRPLMEGGGPLDVTRPRGRRKASPNSLQRAVTAYELGDLREALKAAEAVIALDPEHWQAYQLVLDILSTAGSTDGMPGCFQSLAKRTNLPPPALVLMGMAYEAQGNLPAARELALQALAMDPGSPQGLNLRGVLAFREGDHELAEQSFLQAVARAPDWGDPWTNLGLLMWETGRPEQAVDHLEKGFILAPTAPNVASAYHAAVTASGLFARSLPFFVEAAHCYPNFRPVGYFLVDIHIQLEDWTGAMTAIERMLVRFESEPWMLEAAARVRNQIGPMRPSDTPRDRPSVSLCMIVRNE